MHMDEFWANRRTFLLSNDGGGFVQTEQSKNQGYSQSATLLAHKNSEAVFTLHSEYQPTGDQPQAIEALVNGVKEGNQFQT